MKRTIIILITVLTLSVAGVLYGNHDQSDNEGTVSLEELYTTQFPEQMPDVIMDPIVGFSMK
jgi:hypothetical protein